MRLESARELKEQLLTEMVVPFALRARPARRAGAIAVAAELTQAAGRTLFGVGARPFDRLPEIHRSLALGVARHEGQYRLAVRVQRPSLMSSPVMELLTARAKGEVDVRLIGRIDKRARRPRAPTTRGTQAARAIPWHQGDTRPLQIGASVGHVRITAGTIGAFVKRRNATYILSNNHVLANEDHARAGDWILQRAAYDGGRQPAARVARLRFWIRFTRRRANLVDCALARIVPGIAYDARLLRGLVRGADRRLAGLGDEVLDAGDRVYKVGRTTGATEGRVTAFDLDNLVVNYDLGNLRFDGQVEIEGMGTKAFSDGGDSGSLIVDAKMRAVALLFAGGDTGGANGLGLTYACPIRRVLKDLKATLLW
jgi:hypothetical protein